MDHHGNSATRTNGKLRMRNTLVCWYTYAGLVDHIDDADELATQRAGRGLGDAASFDVASERLPNEHNRRRDGLLLIWLNITSHVGCQIGVSPKNPAAEQKRSFFLFVTLKHVVGGPIACQWAIARVTWCTHFQPFRHHNTRQHARTHKHVFCVNMWPDRQPTQFISEWISHTLNDRNAFGTPSTMCSIRNSVSGRRFFAKNS